MGNKKSDFSEKIWKVGDDLTSIMDQMKEELKRNDDLKMAKCIRALAKAQGQLLKAFFTFDPTYKIPLEAGETWEHFLAKNFLIRELPSEYIFPEYSLGGCILDVLAKIHGKYVIIEAETISVKCVEKARKIKTALADLASGKIEMLESSSNRVLSEIKKQLEHGEPLRLIFVVTREPFESTLKDIKKEQDAFIQPEVYYVSRIPPFRKSSNLLEKI